MTEEQLIASLTKDTVPRRLWEDGLWNPPECLKAVLACPICGAPLWRASEYWACPDAMHGKLIRDPDLIWLVAERIAVHNRDNPTERITQEPERILFLVKCRQRFLANLLADFHEKGAKKRGKTKATTAAGAGGGR